MHFSSRADSFSRQSNPLSKDRALPVFPFHAFLMAALEIVFRAWFIIFHFPAIKVNKQTLSMQVFPLYANNSGRILKFYHHSRHAIYAQLKQNYNINYTYFK